MGDARPIEEVGRQLPISRRLSSYEYLKLVEQKGQIGVWSWDFTTGAQHWSVGMCQLFGLEAASVQPSMEDFVSLIHPEDRSVQDEQIHDIVNHGIMPDREYRIIRPDGGLRWISCRGEVQRSREGRPERAFGVLFDVTALREAQRSAHRCEQRYKALSQASQVIVWTAGPDGALIEAPSWRSLTGQKYEEFQGSGWLDAVHSEDRDGVVAAWHRAVECGSAYDVSMRIRSITDGYRSFRSRAVPVGDDEGAVCEWIGILVSVPELSSDPSLLTGAQIRAARGLLRWSEKDLSDAAGVSRSTVRRAEDADDVPPGRVQNILAIRTALEKGGVQFTFPSAGKPGVQPR